MSETKTTDAALLALEAWLQNWEPDESGVCLKTTDAILRDLDDMVELEPNAIAAVMAERGYAIRYDGHSGRHGWAMRPRRE
ncbi:MAG: hypothetical protein J5565_06300 [Muribaculaceae bacterium]|nr:hypothetical protein [Muribaculaceae bacterium]